MTVGHFVLLVAIVILSYSAFVTLALSQARPWRAVVVDKRQVPRRGLLRAAGAALLALTFLLTLLREGSAFGVLLWPLILAATAMAVTFTLTWRPHWLRSIAKIGAKHTNE